MLDTFEIFEELSKIFDENSARIMTRTLTKIYDDLSQMVTKEEFKELKGSVNRLAKAQEKTEQRLDALAKAQEKTEQRLDALAKAQEKTEQRLDALAKAQEKTEQRLDALAKAQEKTEQRLDALAKAQEKTEQRLDALAKAQEKTETVVRRLVKDMDSVKKQLGGLADSVGYGLEDKLFPLMPDFILRQYGCKVKLVERKNLVYPSGKYDELNIYIESYKKGQEKVFVGECKAKPGKRDIRKFVTLLERVKAFLKTDIQGILIGYIFDPQVEQFLHEQFPYLDFYKTYEIEKIAKTNPVNQEP